MKKSFVFIFLLTAMVSQAAPKGGHPVIVSFPITEDPCAVQSEKTEKIKGTVNWYNEDKRYGFIIPDDGGTYCFFHGSTIRTVSKTLNEGDRVLFERTSGQKGQQANEIELIK